MSLNEKPIKSHFKTCKPGLANLQSYTTHVDMREVKDNAIYCECCK